MISRAVDYLVELFAPVRAMQRLSARATIQQINEVSGTGGGYDAGKVNRLTQGRIVGSATENSIPQGQIARLRWSSWDLFRNNPHARKIVRSLESKVIGKGPRPNSSAKRLDGSPHVEFRQKAQQLWSDVSQELDFRGRPGRGGQSITGLGKAALRSVMLNGDCLFRFRDYSLAKAMRLNLHVPMQVQLINSDRIDNEKSSFGASNIYRGFEVDEDGIPTRIWIRDTSFGETSTESRPYPANEFGHVFVADDIDQIRGTPWFASALLQMRDTADYQFNELKASALAACVTLGVRRPKGIGAGSFGAQVPQAWSLADGDGNPITAMQPGMVIDLGQDGEINGFNPSRPTTNTEAFIQHLLRSTAASLPGVKGSTLTMDYRGSSFSSERSADNDAWPEIEGLQQWFYDSFYQPIYEAVITAGVVAGYFDDILTADEFGMHRSDLLAAEWQGPIALSINPTDDIKAAAGRIAAGLSTPQIEAAKLGNNWREILRQLSEFTEAAKQEQIEEDLVEQYLGLDPAVNAKAESAAAAANGETGSE